MRKLVINCAIVLTAVGALTLNAHADFPSHRVPDAASSSALLAMAFASLAIVRNKLR
jgi:hypothetical protein